jgi:diguanylate cyclase (GGDEF)-like protein
MADRRARIITNQINNSFDQMEKALSFIVDEGVSSQVQLREAIGKVKSLLSLNRFALVDEDNVVYTQYTTYTGRSRHEFLAEAQIDGRHVSTASLYGSSKQLCLVIPTPELSLMGKQFKACFIQIDIKDIVDLLAFDDQGRTYFSLYTQNGGNLSGTELGPVISTQNILEATKDLLPEDDWNENRDRFAVGAGGTMRFASGGGEETLCYVPVEGTGWEIAVLIRDSVIQDQIRNISERNAASSRNHIIFTLVAVLLLAAVLLLQLRDLAKDEIEKEKEAGETFHNMAKTDSMTGVRNKRAYTETEAALDRRIQDHEIRKLAVVACDINGLKHVNDTQGHSAGDQLIKDACALICACFKHGAVFRTGGDEFTVILQDQGFDTMDEAVSRMNRQVEENIEKGAVVVSIGCAVLEPGDQRLQDMFERADKIMYERKQELKAMGAQTR